MSLGVAVYSPKTSGGGVLFGPLGTPLPTDASAALNAAMKPLGPIGREGIVPSGEAASKKDLDIWGGEVVASVTENKSIDRFRFTLVGIFDEEAAKFVFGSANVTVTPATALVGKKISIQVKGDDIADGVLVFEQKFKGKKMRDVIPNGSSVVVSELPRTHTDLGGYEVEVTCLPDANGVRSFRYLEDDETL